MSKSNRKQRPTTSQRLVEREKVDQLIDQVFGGEMHAQRVASLANGVDGVFMPHSSVFERLDPD